MAALEEEARREPVRVRHHHQHHQHHLRHHVHRRRLQPAQGPPAIATYCLPSSMNVIGGPICERPVVMSMSWSPLSAR